MLNRFGHLLSLVLPLTTLLFLISAPHSAGSALIWTLPFWLLLLADGLNLDVDAKPGQVRQLPPAFFDRLLYALAVLQFVNLYLMLRHVSELPWSTPDDWLTGVVTVIVIRFLVGTTSGTSGIVLAHEMIHRPQTRWQVLGRLLLCSVCYAHFAIAHQRSHHLNLGLTDDITTAKFGESFKDYWKRVRFGFLAYAWRSEQQRLHATGKSKRLLRNEVLGGLLAECLLLLTITVNFGLLAAAMFIYQAYAAVKILEAVNYFQHWGLESGQFGPSYGWVTHSSISRYALIGLSNHIGHHLDENKPYFEIPFSTQGPQLPFGYFVMNLWIKLNNESYRKMAAGALEDFRNSLSLESKIN